MSAARTVGLLKAGGEIRFFTQRPEPYTNCMFAAVCVPLSYMGYDLPSDFVARLREASGVPRERATSTGDTRRALNELIRDCPIEYGGLDDDVLLKRLANEEIVARVLVRVGDLPAHSPTRRHFKPNSTGGHAVTLAKAEQSPGDGLTVLWIDPMGRPVNNYSGVRVPFRDIEPALKRTPKGRIRVTYGWKDSALDEKADEVNRGRMGPMAGNPILMPPPIVDPAADALVLTRGRPDEFVKVPARTDFVHPITRAFVTRSGEESVFRLAGRTTDGKFAGIWVKTRHVAGSRGATLLLVDRELIGVPFTEPD